MIYIIISILVVALMAMTGLWVNSRTLVSERNERIARLGAEREALEKQWHEDRLQYERRVSSERDSLSRSLDAANTERTRLEERLRFIEDEKERLATETEQRFKLLAGSILDDNSRRFKEQSESRLGEMLTPLREELERFKKSVNDAYNNEARERFALSERIRELVQLNETIGREARDLTKALRGDSKVQGDWGEMILETLLERSGLKKGIHFDLQVTTDKDGKTLRNAEGVVIRPDAVIYYPDERCVVVDSKVSLTSYVELINREPGSPEYNEAAQGHLRSIKSHIKELATKNYQDFIGDKKADFVTMFIPNEGAYMAAMNLQPSLWQDAYDQRVLIVSPTHLLSFLRFAEQMWRQDDMKRNVLEISAEGGKMYDKFVGFLEDMSKIEKGIMAVDMAYKEAMGKLQTGRGNLIGKAEKLRAMGAKTTKAINSRLVGNALGEGEDE